MVYCPTLGGVPSGEVWCFRVKIWYDRVVCWGRRVYDGADEVFWGGFSVGTQGLGDLARCMRLEIAEEDEVSGWVFAFDQLCTGGVFAYDRLLAVVLMVVDRADCYRLVGQFECGEVSSPVCKRRLVYYCVGEMFADDDLVELGAKDCVVSVQNVVMLCVLCIVGWVGGRFLDGEVV